MHVDNKRIVDGLWKGENICVDPKEGDADLWITIWAEFQLLASREISEEVEHVMHRTKKDKKETSHPNKFVTEGNEEADDLAKAGAMLDEGIIAEARAKPVQQEREDMYAAFQKERWFFCGQETGATFRTLDQLLSSIIFLSFSPTICTIFAYFLLLLLDGATPSRSLAFDLIFLVISFITFILCCLLISASSVESSSMLCRCCRSNSLNKAKILA